MLIDDVQDGELPFHVAKGKSGRQCSAGLRTSWGVHRPKLLPKSPMGSRAPPLPALIPGMGCPYS